MFEVVTHKAITLLSGLFGGILTTLADSSRSLYGSFISSDSPVVGKIAEFAGMDSSILGQYFESIKAYILENFGEPGLYATYIAVAAIVIFVLSKLFKLSFAILKLVVVPSVALAFVATFFLPQSFFHFLPVTVSLFSVLLLFRG